MTQTSPYEFYGPSLCVRGKWLYEEACVITEYQYKNYVNRGHLNVLRPGKGKDNYALVEFESMRAEVKQKVISICDPKPMYEEYNILRDLIKPDNAALTFFVNHKKPDGSSLAPKKQQQYATEAFLLNACKEFFLKNIARRKKAWIFEQLSIAINDLKEEFDHKLPSEARGLSRRYYDYIEDGYYSLLHGNEGNVNSRKVTDQLNDLILSIYCMKNKPFECTTLQIYLQFLGGSIQIVDINTGELYNASDFQKDGKPLVVSEGTIHNIINSPKNRALVDKYRSGSLQYNGKHRPHHHRYSPQFSLSKISMDDRDLPRKMKDGNRVKAYYAYDVASGCVIGASYSRFKDDKLFIDCVKDMLLFLQRNDLGIPMELEVEHHLVNRYKNDLMLAGTCFPFVRWCAVGNSQEKRAEHFNKSKKYGYEKRYQDGIGRWYAKSEAYRTIVEKVFDEHNNTYKDKKYEYETLVAEDKEIIDKYNNDFHPNQKQYKGKTRMQVLLENVNEKLSKFDEVIWARYVGSKTSTTIRRNQYVKVQHENYTLPSPQILNLLAVGNYEVDAYWMKNEAGEIDKVFLYQNDQFICECEKLERYNEATAEQTSKDKSIMGKQAAYVREFDEMVKESKVKVAKLELIEASYPKNTQETEDIIYTPTNVVEDDEDNFERLLADFNPDEIKEKVKNDF